MAINFQRARQFLQQFNFRQLFAEELNWATPSAKAIHVDADGETYQATPIAEQGGMMVFDIGSRKDGLIPGRSVQLKLHRRIAQTYAEHILVFVNAARSSSLWVWVKRQDGRLQACDHWYHGSQPGDSLLQKLNGIAFTYDQLDEDGRIAIGPVLDAVEASFRAERVTKRFYEQFEKEHAVFLKFIDGIPDEALQKWYASVMLNRLMFIYFIQRKLFLNGDRDYLRHKLEGGDYPQGFYRDFLCPLFFKGFARKEAERSESDRKLLGPVPYLNGGIFQQHEIERLHGRAIEIPDKAFARIFDFFDGWHWQLDERPLRQDDEINPDVLGYIFEKYINRKQMGAYYTKEDITGYISRNTILPFLFDAARQKCSAAFEGEASVWTLLRDDPDRYIYEAVRKGSELDLPTQIAVGIKDVPKRETWNKPAPAEFALPTEIWREVVARRQRCEDLRRKLSAADVHDINDLITLNLDIVRFAQDVVENAEPDLLNAFYKELKAITVLDPTCGSGAFLFAALNILYPLYEACLNRMRVFVEEWQRVGDKTHRNYAKWFAAEIKAVEEDHPNQRYFILKTIILNNLYGVDIMKEATEICRLRLFLKLAAQVDPAPAKPNMGIEPLPDIDFNIRAGNTLVGFATADEAEKTIRQDLLAYNTVWPEIREKVENAARHYQMFKDQQTKHGGEITPEDKKALSEKFGELEDKLNRYLAADYGIEDHKKKNYEAWLKSHRPFHWFVEFHGIMAEGGFDAVIGNPPYYDLKQGMEYQLRDYKTLSTKNLYPVVMERALPLCRPVGRLGLIVPISSISTEGYSDLQAILLPYPGHFSSYDDRPARLFDGLEHIQLTIHLLLKQAVSDPVHFVTECYRWSTAERAHLFPLLEYQPVSGSYLPGCLPKISTAHESSILQKLWADKTSLGACLVRISGETVYYSRKVHNFLQALDFVPKVYDGKGKLRPPSELKPLLLPNQEQAASVFCTLNSTLFRWYINVFTDCRHVNKREVDGFRCDLETLIDAVGKEDICRLGRELTASLKKTSEYREMKFAHDTLRVQCIIPKHSKPIIDEIDRVLARHYGFTDEELDFIINYDIKYRMGLAGDADAE